MSEDELYALITAPDFAWIRTSQKIAATASFMNRTGLIKFNPCSWTDLHMPEVDMTSLHWVSVGCDDRPVKVSWIG